MGRILKKDKENFKIKKVLKKLDFLPLKEIIKFLNWFSEYNIVPKGMSLKKYYFSGKAISPSKFDIQKNFKYRLVENNLELSREQKKCFKDMNKLNEKFRVHVLQGTTRFRKNNCIF